MEKIFSFVKKGFVEGNKFPTRIVPANSHNYNLQLKKNKMNYSVALLLVVLIYSRYAEVAEAARGRQRNRQHTQSSSEAQTTVGKLGNRRTLTKTTTKKEATVEPTQQLINDSPEHDGRKLSDLPSNVDLTYPPCIANESDLGYINGRLSFEETFLNCLNNIADVGSLPTLDNGNLNGTMQVGTNIVLNNLHEVVDCCDSLFMFH